MVLALWIVGVLFVIIGLAGVILPGLPGAWLIVGGLALAAGAEDFARVGVTTMVVIVVLGLASYALDFVAASIGVRKLGASSRAMVGAALGTLLGLSLGLVGVIVGPFVGAVIGEWTVHRDMAKAGKAGAGAWLGFAIGAALKVGVALLMIGIFLTALIF
jgi:uncharacterized protein YqgC (DUF456 family)